VISVVVYGRNDAHGYNLHRRAALSLNCLAEVLSHPDDEIIFVDYNTPDELPTFAEALADTLTDRCLSLLRVVRVPAAIHEQRFAGRTHLPAIEPVARNAGVRRANPSNRWLLSTNTDMILLTHSDQSLSEICNDLRDGFYGLPRYELPEWLWERLPRTDPRAAMSEIARLGPSLRLDEPTVSIGWIRFDAPGDFQLMLRDDFLAIDGFNEDMVLGYHVDSNLSRRMLLYRGSIESLGEALAGYHCNHNRERTIYHRAGTIVNDPDRFVYAIDQPKLPAQRTNWGLAGAALEEVPASKRLDDLADALVAAIRPGDAPPAASDAGRVPYEVTYDSGHVLPFIVDALAVTPSDAVIGYLGVNPILEAMLASVVARLGFRHPVQIAKLDDGGSVDKVARATQVFVIDLGLDRSLVEAEAAVSTLSIPEPPRLPPGLDLVFAGLERLVELERTRIGHGEHPRRMMLVHSSTVFWDSFVLSNLDCSYTTPHSRVRRATVKPVPDDDEKTRAAIAHEHRLIRWASRGGPDRGSLRLAPGKPLELADLDDYRGFGEGWSYPDEGGVWTQGSRSALAVVLDGVEGNGDYVLALSVDGVCIGPDRLLIAELWLDDVRVASRPFGTDLLHLPWHIELPPHVLAGGKADLSIAVNEPSSPLAVGWSTNDDRPLGILIRRVALAAREGEATKSALVRERRMVRWATRGVGQGRLHLRLGEALELADLDDYRGFRDGWAYPDEAGIWTLGCRSDLVLALDGVEESDLFLAPVLALSLGGVCVLPEAPLKVDLLLNEERVASRLFTQDVPVTWRIDLPTRVLADDNLHFSFLIDEPRSPRAVGWSIDDERPLGILVHGMAARAVDRTLGLGEIITFAAGSHGDRFLGEGWGELESTGVWTVGEEASLILELAAPRQMHVELVLDTTAFVAPDHPKLEVEVSVQGERLADQVFRHGNAHRQVHVKLPTAAGDESGRTVVGLVLRDPASPVDLGLSGDVRRLGLHLHLLTTRRTGGRWTLSNILRDAIAKLRGRLR
jgi:hypothetical protein